MDALRLNYPYLRRQEMEEMCRDLWKHGQVTRKPTEPPSIPAYGTFSKNTKDRIFDIDFMR